MDSLFFPILILLGYLAWQDFRYRSVYWYVFPALGILVVFNAVLSGVWPYRSIFANVLVLLMQFSLLHGYFLARHGRWLMAGQQYLGWGDVCFMAVLALSFSPLNFLAFELLSLVAMLLACLVLRLAGRQVRQVPLAGGQALQLALVLLADHAGRGVNLYNDYPIEQLLWAIYGG